MGGGSSKPAAPLLERPWRKINGDKQSALQYVNNYKPQSDGLQLRILLHGPAGGGKSSFINTATSVLRGRISTLALAANLSDGCTTKEFTTYKIPKGKEGDAFYPFVFNDMMGLQERSRRNRKIHVKHVKQLLKGHVKEGYTFNPECKISKKDQYYNDASTLNDKVHVLVSVIDANTESLMKDKAVETLMDIRDEATDLGIPQVVIFTKVDKVCPEIKNKVKNVYRSIKLQEKMEQFSADVGIPINCIFAVKNYTNTNLDNDTDVLILDALRHIIDFGDDFLNKMLNDQADA